MAISYSPRLIPHSFGADLGYQDETLPPKLDINVGPKSHIFQPPRTPSARSSLFRSSSSPNVRSPLVSAAASASPKRPRLPGELRGRPSTSSLHMDSASASMVGSASFASPAPLVNTKYLLAGGLDTPTSAAALAYEKLARDHDITQQNRHWAQSGRKRSIREDDYDDYGYLSYTPAALAGERNGRARGGRFPASAERRSGWGRSMFTIVGNVAGKVWQFCRASAFRGFYAGGGQAYQINGIPAVEEDGSWRTQNLGASQQQESILNVRRPTCVRTHSPDETLNEKYIAPNDTLPPPAKRIQREKGTGELRSQWIMVSPSGTPNGHALDISPSRGSAQSEAEKLGPNSGTLHGRHATSRLSRRHGHCPSKPSNGSHAGSPHLHARAPASIASTRTPSPSKNNNLDASIQRFNRQLKAMIREGKEALGTRVEVGEEMEDDGGLEGGVRLDYFS
ncbi:MAG: hypothetical protein M1816_000053 [Peltula sp. TS41687]|nr:MAG: hypothetical protein M1816_000053 [Peltula sp. TS41687]